MDLGHLMLLPITELPNMLTINMKSLKISTIFAGLMIHFLPAVGYWEGHCRYRYSLDFAANLAVACQYEVCMLQFVYEEKSIAVCYMRNNEPFIDRASFSLLEET